LEKDSIYVLLFVIPSVQQKQHREKSFSARASFFCPSEPQPTPIW